ncbi:MAG: gas vesicle protein [Acidimicrobiaceae bacterium]|nr:gas vesicle protein [Acidimicrobiaceae bacterium]
MSMAPTEQSPHRRSGPTAQVSLVDLIDRLLGGGAVVAGHVTLSIADVDLVGVSLYALLTSIQPPRSFVDVAGEPDAAGGIE